MHKAALPALLLVGGGVLYLVFRRRGMAVAAQITPIRIVGGSLGDKAVKVLQAYGAYITPEAVKLGISPAIPAAVMAIESGGNGFGADGRLIIRFEPHVFRNRSEHEVVASRTGQDGEYQTLQRAAALDEKAAYESISMGIGQIMGFNAKRVGYPSAKAMFEAFQGSMAAQIAAVIKFLATDANILNAARNEDWQQFARKYNGPGYAANKYDTKLAQATEAGKFALAA